jgi:hypothetical protein
MLATDLIARVIDWLKDFRAKAPAFFQYLINQRTIGRRMRGQRGEMRLGIEQLEKNELLVPQGCVILGHRVTSWIKNFRGSKNLLGGKRAHQSIEGPIGALR